MARTFFISAISHDALALVLASDWWLAKQSSKNVGMRSSTLLPRYDNYWASGSVLGTCTALLVVHLIFHPGDGVALLDPRTWSDWHTIQAIKRLVAWVGSVAGGDAGSFALSD
jgi:hypothetical protein